MGMIALVPGMTPGGTGRNVLVAAVYLLCLAVVVPVVALLYRPVRGC